MRRRRPRSTQASSPVMRRVFRPSLTGLEDRTLLALLQFAGGLGEQSTLDSVVQTENEISNLNTPASQSQQFTHNDGTAVSNVTLTATASNTTYPGVNLDILSQGSVAKKGIASVALTAGLTDTSGNIGAAIPVTIVATNSSETTGEPVNIQFSFSFNVKTFASNNATANFSYSVSYAYDGVTTALANKSYQLGGSGVTPIGVAAGGCRNWHASGPYRRHVHAHLLGQPQRPNDRTIPRCPDQ